MMASNSQPGDPGMGRLSITWLGHSTVLLELDGVRMLTDPVLRRRVGPLLRVAPQPGPESVRAVDCVLLSHLHLDHADIPTLRAVVRSGPILAPHPARDWLVGRGLRDVRDLRAGEATGVGGLRITATPADHSSARRPLGPRANPIGYLIQGSRSAYFAGDTDLFPGMADLRGLAELALLPVWGWGSRLGPGHLDPESAAAATALIAPAVVIPIHWGTLALAATRRRQTDRDRPALAFAGFCRRYAPGVEVRLLTPGARITL